MEDRSFRERLIEYVQDKQFFNDLIRNIEEGENTEFKMRMELLSYIEPKLKTVDPSANNQKKNINITYIEQISGGINEDQPVTLSDEIPEI